MAVDNDIIRKNPAKGTLNENYGREVKIKQALIPEQQEKLLDFVSKS